MGIDKWVANQLRCPSGFLFGKIFLASGMLIHELSVMLVILNAIRLVGYTKRKARWRPLKAIPQ